MHTLSSWKSHIHFLWLPLRKNLLIINLGLGLRLGLGSRLGLARRLLSFLPLSGGNQMKRPGKPLWEMSYTDNYVNSSRSTRAIHLSVVSIHNVATDHRFQSSELDRRYAGRTCPRLPIKICGVATNRNYAGKNKSTKATRSTF